MTSDVIMTGDESICFLYSVAKVVPPIVIDLVSSDDDEDVFENNKTGKGKDDSSCIIIDDDDQPGSQRCVHGNRLTEFFRRGAFKIKSGRRTRLIPKLKQKPVKRKNNLRNGLEDAPGTFEGSSSKPSTSTSESKSLRRSSRIKKRKQCCESCGDGLQEFDV